MNEMLFSYTAEDMHADAAHAEDVARWQDEVNAALADPIPEDLEK